MILVAVRKREAIAGRKMWEPATMWLGSTMAGLTATSSCQRRPSPRFRSASFQRESPVFTVILFNFAGSTRAAALGCSGAMGTAGAAGCEGVTPGSDDFKGIVPTTGAAGGAGDTR